MSRRYTPGPLTVVQEDKFPFEIVIVDAAGKRLHTFDRAAHGSADKTLADVMAAKAFLRYQNHAAIVAMLERQVADAHLTAARTDMFEALEEALPELEHLQRELGRCDHSVGLCYCGLAHTVRAVQNALAKARGEPLVAIEDPLVVDSDISIHEPFTHTAVDA